jgi:hypothetical protein
MAEFYIIWADHNHKARQSLGFFDCLLQQFQI